MKPTLRPLALAAALAVSVPSVTRGQVRTAGGDATASVRGVVVDSTAGGPLEGARVVLWGTIHHATTGEDGRFEIPGVAPGDYSVVFFHPRLAELGVASGGRPVTVEGDEVEVELGVPSHFTLMSVRCAGTGGVTAVGQVYDAGSGLPLGGVEVSLRWTDEDGRPGERIAETETSGWYHACGLPGGRPVAVTSSFLDRNALRREMAVPPGSAVRLDVPMARLRPSRVTATVREARTGEPLPDATVELGVSGGDLRAESDGDGRVTFEDVPPGTYTVRARHLAHMTRTDSVEVPPDVVVAVRVEMASEPIPLPPLEVSVDATRETMSLMGGIEVTPEEIEAVRARSRDLADLLHNQHIPGVIVKRGSTGGVCIEFLTGQVRMFKRTCEPMMVILDGVRLNIARDVFSIDPQVIERLRLFRPIEAGNLFGLGAGAGVLVVTTKSRN